MDKIVKIALLFIAAALTSAIASVSNAANLQDLRNKGVVRIAIANEIPYGFMDLDGQAKGVGPEVAKQIMKRLGIKKIKWSTTGFGSLIPGLRANRYDMVAVEMAIFPQRCQQVLFSEPDSSYGEGLLVAKGNPKNLHSYEQFVTGDEKVAVMAGADQLETLQALGVPMSKIVNISNNADAISIVSTGRANAYAATRLTVSQLASKSDKVEVAQNFTDPIVNGQPVRSWGGFTFAQGSEDFQAAVNAELTKFKQTPEWTKILTKYDFTEADIKASFTKSSSELCAG